MIALMGSCAMAKGFRLFNHQGTAPTAVSLQVEACCPTHAAKLQLVDVQPPSLR